MQAGCITVSDLYKYSVWCTTDEKWVTTDYREEPPTACPENIAHTIDLNKTYSISHVPQQEKRDTSGKLRVHSTARKLGLDTYFTGAGDSPSSPSDSGNGAKFYIAHRQVSVESVEVASGVCTVVTSSEHGFVATDTVRLDTPVLAFKGSVIVSTPTTSSFTVTTSAQDFLQAATTGTCSKNPEVLLCNLNAASNESWIHEGSMQWRLGGDTVIYPTMAIVTIAPVYQLGENTNFTIHPSGLIVPAPGNGTCNILSDLSNHLGGLVYCPDSDLGVGPTAFWDAEWTGSSFSNIAPNPYGTGRYNIFAAQTTLKKYVNAVPLITSEGWLTLSSSDAGQIGQGMQLKVSVETPYEDAPWEMGFLLRMYRKSTL